MVWARTKLMIHDDLLKPRPVVFLKYQGPHPEKFYQEIPHLIARTFRVHEHSIQEKRYHWSKGEPQHFKVGWEVNKDMDKFSYYWLDIWIEGTSSKGKGVANISVSGALRTEYPQDTFWQKTLPYEFLRMFWHTVFYSAKRDSYMRDGRELISIFVEELKTMMRV